MKRFGERSIWTLILCVCRRTGWCWTVVERDKWSVSVTWIMSANMKKVPGQLDRPSSEGGQRTGFQATPCALEIFWPGHSCRTGDVRMDVGRPPDPLGMDHTREIIGRREISAASFSRATSTVYPEAHFSKTTPHRTSLFIVYLALDYLFSSSGCPRSCVSIDSIFPTHRIVRHLYDRCHGIFFRLIPLNYLN